jgi:cytochrome c-type biogenesis protein CcsB
MNPSCFARPGKRCTHCAAVACLSGLGLVGAAGYLEARTLAVHLPLEQLLSYQLTAYANILLIGATVLYISHLWLTARAFGLWASGLAVAGALGLVAALIVHATEVYVSHATSVPMFASLSEVMSLFSAITVILYLAMERAYGTRSAGAFVMPVVAAAAMLEAWLVSNEQALHGNPAILRSYWVAAHVVANFIAYGAFTMAAAMGAMFLLRRDDGSDSANGAPGVFTLAAIERLMHQAIVLGFALFSLAIVLGSVAARAQWGRYWSWDPKETGVLLLWLSYLGYFYCHYIVKWRGARMAWWSIAGFALTMFCFLGVNRYFSVLHSYA